MEKASGHQLLVLQRLYEVSHPLRIPLSSPMTLTF